MTNLADKIEALVPVEALKDPATVYVNMLRGTIAKLPPHTVWALYGAELLDAMPADIATAIRAKAKEKNDG